jgi:hypothetical protein
LRTYGKTSNEHTIYDCLKWHVFIWIVCFQMNTDTLILGTFTLRTNNSIINQPTMAELKTHFELIYFHYVFMNWMTMKMYFSSHFKEYGSSATWNKLWHCVLILYVLWIDSTLIILLVTLNHNAWPFNYLLAKYTYITVLYERMISRRSMTILYNGIKGCTVLFLTLLWWWWRILLKYYQNMKLILTRFSYMPGTIRVTWILDLSMSDYWL